MEKRNVVIYVAGMRFSLSTTDSDEYVIEIGEKIDRLIRGVQKDNPKLNRDACATLVALDICDDETKLFKKLETLREQVKDYVNEIDRLTRENEGLKAEIEKLKSSNPSNAFEAKPALEEKPQNESKGQFQHNSQNRHTAFVGKNMKGKSGNAPQNKPQNSSQGYSQSNSQNKTQSNSQSKTQSNSQNKAQSKPFNVLADPKNDISSEDDLPFQFSFFDNESLNN